MTCKATWIIFYNQIQQMQCPGKICNYSGRKAARVKFWVAFANSSLFYFLCVAIGQEITHKTSYMTKSIQFNSNLYFDTVRNSSGFGTIYNYITIINNNKYISKKLTYNYIKLHLFSMNAVFLI